MAWSDLQVSLIGFGGDTVSVSVYNPQARPETARVSVRVDLDGGDAETLVSANVSVPAGGTKSVQLTASAAIASVTDGPEPIAPA